MLHGFKRICLFHVPPSDFQGSVNLRVLVLALNRNRTYQGPGILPRGRFFKPFIDDLLCKQPTSQSVQRKISSKVGCDVEESYEVEKRPGIDNQGILHRSMIKWHGADNAQNGEIVSISACKALWARLLTSVHSGKEMRNFLFSICYACICSKMFHFKVASGRVHAIPHEKTPC